MISVVLLLGLYSLGKILTKIFEVKNKISKISNPAYQYAMIGSVFLSSFLFPLIIFNILDIKLLIKLIAYTLVFLALIEILNFYISGKIYSKQLKFNNVNLLLFLFLIAYFFLSLAPITNADSLDYHVGIPFYILNNNEYPAYKFWMHFTKSGSGELLNAVGLFIRAEQFPALVQFSGILSISGLLKQNKTKYQNLYLLLFLSCPVLILLVSSAKPQLNFIGTSALIFSLIFFTNEKYINQNRFLFFSLILLFSNINGKFSFALSSFLFLNVIFYYCYKNNRIHHLIFIFFVVFFLTLGPKIIWKHNVYGMNLIDALIKPLPIEIYGYQQLYNSLTSCGYSGCIPTWLLFPTSLNTITETLGIGSIVILFSKFKKYRGKFNIYIHIIIYYFCIFLWSK